MDVERGKLPSLITQYKYLSDVSDRALGSDRTRSADRASPSKNSGVRKREIFAWAIIFVQSALLLGLQRVTQSQAHSHEFSEDDRSLHTPLSINGKLPTYHQSKLIEANANPESTTPFYDSPTLYPKEVGMVSRVWHSNGSPDINGELQKGSCWCSGDDYCMCTPSLAVDVILTSGPDHLWMVERVDNGKLALMGGFNEVGETVEEAVRRELAEEMNILLPNQNMRLFGVYSDPKRDRRKHAVSIVFIMSIPEDVTPRPGDDVSQVRRVALKDVAQHDLYIDHKTIVNDFVHLRSQNFRLKSDSVRRDLSVAAEHGVSSPFRRSVCSYE